MGLSTTTNPAPTLLELLFELAERELDERELEHAEARLRAALAELGEPAVAERLTYDCYEVDWFGLGPKRIQGLALAESELLLTEIVDQLAALDDVELEGLFGSLKLDAKQARSALYAIYWILNCLEWESRDRMIADTYPEDQRERMLAASLRSLINYRKTGEP